MMTSLSMVEAKLPPGFRFHPRDEELVCDYLMKKIAGSQQLPPFLLEVDLNKSEPWEIPDSACVGGKDWYFYSQRDRKYATGLRTNRATVSGYWKATGKDRPVVAKGGGLVGMRKTLVFYEGRAPKGKKTDWVMHEFRLEGALSSLATVSSPSSKDDWVLCRVFHKSKQIGTTKLHGIGSISCNSIGSYEQEDDKPYSNFSSLPPLMEQPYITFDQSHAINDNNNETPTTDHFQQVPCFSIFTSDQISQPPFSQNTNTIFPNENNNPIFGGFMLPENIATYSVSSSSSCDNNKDVVKAVLDHLARIETNNNDASMKDQSPRFGEENSEIFLSEIGLPTSVWNNQY